MDVIQQAVRVPARAMDLALVVVLQGCMEGLWGTNMSDRVQVSPLS